MLAGAVAIEEGGRSDLAVQSGSVGRSMGPEIAVMSPEGALLAPGEEGEIVVKGPTVMSGYLNDSAAIHEAVMRAGFARAISGGLTQMVFCMSLGG